MKTSFVNVPVNADADNAINTTAFLDAAEELTKLFDLLGSVAFNPVKNDIQGNITKIRKRQVAAPAESETLHELVINELKTKKHDATEGLVWLVRYVLPLSPPFPPPYVTANIRTEAKVKQQRSRIHLPRALL